jgi:hypothetical protein
MAVGLGQGVNTRRGPCPLAPNTAPLPTPRCAPQVAPPPAAALGVPEAVTDEEAVSPGRERRTRPAPPDPYHLAPPR